MNRDEQGAEAYLRRQFPDAEITYEPDGNVPPDFFVRGGPAVEVRRLNRHDFSLDPPQPVERDSIPLWKSVMQLLATFGAPTHGNSWFVLIELKELPGSTWKAEVSRIKQFLSTAANAQNAPVGPVQLSENLEIQMLRASNCLEQMFWIGTVQTKGGGFLVVSELKKNIEYLASQKLAKIAPFRANYQDWWLVLVNHISPSLYNRDRQLLQDCVQVTSDWQRVVLLDSIDPSDELRI